MIIQTANIIAGFALAAPGLKDFGAKETIEKIYLAMEDYVGYIGLVELVLGVLALIERMGIIYFHIPDFGSSYPQALPAIAIGLVLSVGYFNKYPVLLNIINTLSTYKTLLGIAGILTGLISLLFGCILCIY